MRTKKELTVGLIVLAILGIRFDFSDVLKPVNKRRHVSFLEVLKTYRSKRREPPSGYCSCLGINNKRNFSDAFFESFDGLEFKHSLFRWELESSPVSIKPQRRDIVLIIVESLDFYSFRSKLKRTFEYMETARIIHYESKLLRVGENSIPNRCPLLTGKRHKSALRCNVGFNTSLHTAAVSRGFSLLIGDVIGSGHYTNTMDLLHKEDADLMRANARTLRQKYWCSPDPGCINLPYPASQTPGVSIPHACNNISYHELLFERLDLFSETRDTFSILNFYDFHPGHFDKYSVDMDESIASFLHVSSQKHIFVVGDHGHGLQERGEAGALYVPPRGTLFNSTCFGSTFMTTFSIHQFVQNLIQGNDICMKFASHETRVLQIAPEFMPIDQGSGCDFLFSFNSSTFIKVGDISCIQTAFGANHVIQFNILLGCEKNSARINFRMYWTSDRPNNVGSLITPITAYNSLWKCSNRVPRAWLNITTATGIEGRFILNSAGGKPGVFSSCLV